MDRRSPPWVDISAETPAPSCFCPVEPHRPFLLAADVDGTLLGDDEGEPLLREFVRGHSNAFRLAVVTGRTLSSVNRLTAQGRLPRPDYVASSVGAELVACNDPTNALGREYAARAIEEWDLELIYALGEGAGIRRQEFPDGQPRLRAGFHWDGAIETLEAFRRRLASQPRCRVLPSARRYIDVLPFGVGKGAVVQFLQRRLGLAPERVVVAGDSGNDRDMFESGFNGVVPANALPELREAACRPWHYHSRLPAARGVIDGLCHFGFVRVAQRS